MRLKENRPLEPEPAAILALCTGLALAYGAVNPDLVDPEFGVRAAQASVAPREPSPQPAAKTPVVSAEPAPQPAAGSPPDSLPDFPRRFVGAECRVEEILDPDSRSMLTYHFTEKQIRHREGGKTEKVIPFARLDDAGTRHAQSLQQRLPANCRTL